MKKVLFYTLIAAMFLTSCKKLVSFVKEKEPEKPIQEEITDIEYNFDIVNGITGWSGLQKKPTCSFKLTKGDEGTNYVLNWKIDQGEFSKVNVWAGREVNLSENMSGLSEEGEYTLIYNISRSDGKGKVVSGTEKFYIKGEDISITKVTLETDKITTKITEKSLEFRPGQKGVLSYTYTPEETKLLIRSKTSKENLFTIKTIDNQKGIIKISFEIPDNIPNDETSLTFEFVNGPTIVSEEYIVAIKEDTEGKSFNMSVTCDDFTIQGHDLNVDAEAAGGRSGQRFNVGFYIDDNLVAEDKGVTVEQVAGKSIQTNGMEVGDHVLKVVITDIEKPDYRKEKELVFTLLIPRLLVGNGIDSHLIENNDSFEVTVGDNYSLAVDGVPVKFKDCFSISSENGSDQITGGWPWTLKSTHYGKGDILMHVALSNNRNVNYVFHVLRNDTCMFAMELTHNYVKQEGEDSTSECLLSLSVTSSQYAGKNLFSANTTTRYHGVCSYLSGNKNAIKKGEDPVNEEAITYTEKQTLYGALDPVTSDKGIIANLTERAQEIEAMTYSSGYWYIRDLEELTAPVWREGKFPYRFTISDIKLNITTSDEEGLKYIVNIKGLPTDCNLQTDKKNLRFSR